jgi:hypothetical protein
VEDEIYKDMVIHGKTNRQTSETPNMVQVIATMCKSSKTAYHFQKIEVSVVVKT